MPCASHHHQPTMGLRRQTGVITISSIHGNVGILRRTLAENRAQHESKDKNEQSPFAGLECLSDNAAGTTTSTLPSLESTDLFAHQRLINQRRKSLFLEIPN